MLRSLWSRHGISVLRAAGVNTSVAAATISAPSLLVPLEQRLDLHFSTFSAANTNLGCIPWNEGQQQQQQQCHLAVDRAYSSQASDDYTTTLNFDVEEINTLFAEGRDEIEYAREDAETTYFNESVAEAKKCVDACLEKWETLLARLPAEERAKIVRGMGLKMEQLKAEFDQLNKTHS